MWVFPFRDLRIKGYLLLPEAFRSLSRLSSALSAKASTLRSFMHNQLEGSRGNGFLPHMYSVTCVGSGQFFTLFSSKCCNCYNSFLFITITSDVLIFSSISYMRFSRYIRMSRMFPFHPMENTRFELVTSCLQGRRSPN